MELGHKNPIWTIHGNERLRWHDVIDHGDGTHDACVAFTDTANRNICQIRFQRIQISQWHLQESIYDTCDQIEVIDRNLDGDQLDFGCYVIRFIRRGTLIGEHVADVFAEDRRA